MSMITERLLQFAGAVAILGAILHVVVLIGGPTWIAAVNAPPAVVESSRRGTWLAPTAILAITLAILACALYAFSGAGTIARLPFLGGVLALIAALCLLRGGMLIPMLIMRPSLIHRIGAFEMLSSLLFIVLGVAYALGARLQFIPGLKS